MGDKKVEVKLHPDRAISSNLPDQLPEGNWVVGYDTHIQIEGNYVLKFSITMRVRGEMNTEYTYRMDVKCGFKQDDVVDKEHYYYLCNYCYQTAIIEFNKSLDHLVLKNKYMDAQFESYEDIKRKIDNASDAKLN
jgi:hypothetical protein